MRILLTGSAGFIGYHLARRLLAEGHEVVGFDGLTDYYDVRLKRARHAQLADFGRFRAIIGRLEDAALVEATVAEARPEIVLHLAAQAGVRYSLEQPRTYVEANLVGTFNLLEALKRAPPRHLLAASSSSVYGGNDAPLSAETDRTDFPVSIYAATKRGAEAMQHSYAGLFGLPTTCLRFFTVYGPWGRPDMAALRFASAIEAGAAIDVYGEGRMQRDFTYVDDTVEAVRRLIDKAPETGVAVAPTDSISPVAPWRSVNVAGGSPRPLGDFIDALEAALGRRAERRLLPMQPGDVASTAADTRLLRALIGYVPATPVAEGCRAFVDWYRRDWAAIVA